MYFVILLMKDLEKLRLLFLLPNVWVLLYIASTIYPRLVVKVLYLEVIANILTTYI